jgi:predicted DNA-binding transcriptional regulator AlpA
MSMQEVIAYLEVSRATVYKFMRTGRLTPLPRNPVTERRPLQFNRAAVYALRPDKAPHLDAAPARLLAEDGPGYDPAGGSGV